jgi:DNA-binding CsgD family transcriptional regulator
VASRLALGRTAFGARAWHDAFAHLTVADRAGPLATADLERLAVAAYLSAQDERSVDAWSRAHQACLAAGQVPRAARCGFWIALQLLAVGEWARAGGWLATAQRLLDRVDECPEQGLLLVLSSRRSLKDGNLPAARDASRRALDLAGRFGDDELKAFGLLSLGLVHARTGDARAATVVFDEAMVAVTTGDISPIAVGTVYCAVIEACYEILDVARAREWTDALSRWCAGQPQLVPFRGQCLVHRAETLRLTGAWTRAAEQATQACGAASELARADEVLTTAQPSARLRTVGAALYELAEIHRMRGAFGDAEQAYRHASQFGRSPEPGLALLRLAQGRVDAAVSSIRRLLEEPQKRLMRANILAACVEIMTTVGDLATARTAVEELASMTRDVDASYLRALSRHAEGSLWVASGEPKLASSALRAAWLEWQTLEMPYEAARARALIGRCCHLLGDHDAAALELDAAHRVFRRLGAAPDMARVRDLAASTASSSAESLTARELQVIKLIAAGRTNRAIAAALAISERTVDRHVSNIFTKLDLASRSAATAYAYEHGLV